MVVTASVVEKDLCQHVLHLIPERGRLQPVLLTNVVERLLEDNVDERRSAKTILHQVAYWRFRWPL